MISLLLLFFAYSVGLTTTALIAVNIKRGHPLISQFFFLLTFLILISTVTLYEFQAEPSLYLEYLILIIVTVQAVTPSYAIYASRPTFAKNIFRKAISLSAVIPLVSLLIPITFEMKENISYTHLAVGILGTFVLMFKSRGKPELSISPLVLKRVIPIAGTVLLILIFVIDI